MEVDIQIVIRTAQNLHLKYQLGRLGKQSFFQALEALAHACGFERVLVVDPYDIAGTRKAIKDELEVDAPSLIISRRPCILLKEVKKNPPYHVESDKCIGCKACVRIGCPAISFRDGKSYIDFTQCTGCGMCQPLCKFDAIQEGK